MLGQSFAWEGKTQKFCMLTEELDVKQAVQNQSLVLNDEDSQVFWVHCSQMFSQSQKTTSSPRGTVVLHSFCKRSFGLSNGH